MTTGSRLRRAAAVLALAAGAVAAQGASAQVVPDWAYPPQTATGVPEVDAAIGAVLSHDSAALTGQVAFTPHACSAPGTGGSGGLSCADGEPEGTLVPAFLVSVCEGSFLRSGDPAIATAARSVADADIFLHSVFRLRDDSPAPGATHAIVFGAAADPGVPAAGVPGEQEAIVVFTGAGGIRGLGLGCGTSAAQRVQDLGVASFVLAPREAPSAPSVGNGPAGAGSRGPGIIATTAAALLLCSLISGAALALQRRGRSPIGGDAGR